MEMPGVEPGSEKVGTGGLQAYQLFSRRLFFPPARRGSPAYNTRDLLARIRDGCLCFVKRRKSQAALVSTHLRLC